ncbi:MAG: NAD-dependent succinate-semialdehyde dehydrogenase [Polyangiales bacterium]
MSEVALIRGRAYVAGDWVETGTHLDVLDPATGEQVGRVPRCGAEEARAAVDAASGVFQQWRSLSALDRAAPLHRMARTMERREEELGVLLTREQGKPLAEARTEIRYAASFLTWFAEEARRMYGETIPAPSADRRVFVLRQPVGVGVAITPWNFPCAMITRKLGPALAAGCPLILKPAEATPLSALALAAIAEEAGIPAGAFSVLTGDRDDAADLGDALIGDPRVRKLSFTGSTAVGKKLLEASAPTVKRVSLELGGNAPFVVLDDADVDAAVAGCLIAKFRNAGQTCVAANRILVQDGIYVRFRDALAQAIKALRVGPGLEPGVQIGPLIDRRAFDKVRALVADARDAGARSTVGGGQAESGGTFFTPTLLEDVRADMRISREEVFGPVAPLTRFGSDAEGMALANGTPAGLIAYLYGRDFSRLVRGYEALEAGMVGVNTGLVSTAEVPFGGWKESGLGREGSRHGLEDWTELKSVTVALE